MLFLCRLVFVFGMRSVVCTDFAERAITDTGFVRAPRRWVLSVCCSAYIQFSGIQTENSLTSLRSVHFVLHCVDFVLRCCCVYLSDAVLTFTNIVLLTLPYSCSFVLPDHVLTSSCPFLTSPLRCGPLCLPSTPLRLRPTLLLTLPSF